jgi:hypothetical protein
MYQSSNFHIFALGNMNVIVVLIIRNLKQKTKKETRGEEKPINFEHMFKLDHTFDVVKTCSPMFST